MVIDSPTNHSTASQADEQSRGLNLLSLWRIPIVKQALSALLLSLLGGATIAYFSSRLFIRSYLETIGFNGLIYESLVNSETVSAFALAIFLITTSYIFTFAFPSMVLRYFYHDSVHLIRYCHDNHIKTINHFMVAALFFPPISMLLLAISGWNIGLFFGVILLISFSLFRWIIKKQNDYHDAEANLSSTLQFKGELFGVMLTFSGLLAITFFPFYIMLKAIDNIDKDFVLSVIGLMVIWLLYSLFYGLRITRSGHKEYAIDIVFALGMLISTLIYSANTVKIPIAEFAGIKDKSANVYQLSGKDFLDVKKQIDSLWLSKGLSNCTVSDSKKQACYVLSATNRLSNDSYLFTQVVFRDSKNAIICPPDLKVDKNTSKSSSELGLDLKSQCFLVKSEILRPTALAPSLKSQTGLYNKNEKILINSTIIQMNKLK